MPFDPKHEMKSKRQIRLDEVVYRACYQLEDEVEELSIRKEDFEYDHDYALFKTTELFERVHVAFDSREQMSRFFYTDRKIDEETFTALKIALNGPLFGKDSDDVGNYDQIVLALHLFLRSHPYFATFYRRDVRPDKVEAQNRAIKSIAKVRDFAARSGWSKAAIAARRTNLPQEMESEGPGYAEVLPAAMTEDAGSESKWAWDKFVPCGEPFSTPSWLPVHKEMNYTDEELNASSLELQPPYHVSIACLLSALHWDDNLEDVFSLRCADTPLSDALREAIDFFLTEINSAKVDVCGLAVGMMVRFMRSHPALAGYLAE
jgi:hypothetical protein